jgi:hypothetical protein
MTKQTSAGEAWINPRFTDMAVLPDGYEMPVGEAEQRGFKVVPWPDSAKTASPNPYDDYSVITERGRLMPLRKAKALGFTISTAVRDQTSANDPARTWRTAVMQLPEASTRPAATAELLTTQSHSTMTVDVARAFLRGLPVEQTEAPKPVTTTTQNDPRAARLAEIEMSMKDFNRSKGYSGGRAGQGLAVTASLAAAAADPVKLKRLTEIRANALALRIQNGEAHLAAEHKKLSYVLTAHDQTGVPLATLMTQIGIDASQIVKGI